jgi:glycosyltransferase involved in cell wall biosynthesis
MKAVIAADLAPVKVGSLEHALFTVARLLRDRGLDVQTWFGGSMAADVCDHFGLRPGQAVTDLGPLADPQARARWLERFRREQPDIIWLHFFPPTGFIHWQIARACPGAAICEHDRISRGYPPCHPFKAVLRRLRSAIFRRYIGHYLAVSQFIGRRLCDVDHVPSDQISVVYNGIDLDRFTPSETSGSYLAAICSMRPEKGVAVLLQALALLKAGHFEPECRLVGAGPELPAYQAFADAHGLRKVSFLGLRNDVPEILRGAMLTVVPSVWPEAFGWAAAESQAAGVPVIASRIGGLPEVVEDGVTGVLVPPGEAVPLAEAIATMAADPVRRRAMGQAARLRVLDRFNLRTIAPEVVRLLLAAQRARVPAAQPFRQVPASTNALEIPGSATALLDVPHANGPTRAAPPDSIPSSDPRLLPTARGLPFISSRAR